MTKRNEQDELRSMVDNNVFEPFIRHIRFPKFKNLAKDTKVEFTYPITALVGPNGTNKSSVLKALFGAPGHNNLGNLWFSTCMDPIEETGDSPSCFIYGYWNKDAKKVVEILKTRIRKEEDPDYWEPSRPVVKYGMERITKSQDSPGRSATRWNPIDKNVVYLDFRATLSAYDKFFYHGELRNKQNTDKNKKKLIRSRSNHLKSAIETGKSSYFFYGANRIGKENRLLSKNELREISTILGREYSEIRLIRHTFFYCDAYTSFIRATNLGYTEAFAGSGEFAIIRLVSEIINAPNNSLILLDEPEVSLHPGAQERLISFLSRMVKSKKHQIIFSSHSPTLVRQLPDEAIKVFIQDSTGQVIMPKQLSLPEEAFFHIGEPAHNKITVIVEDALAKEIVLKTLRIEGDTFLTRFDVLFFPGGANTLWSHYAPRYSVENRNNMLILFDGDKCPAENFPDTSTIPPNEKMGKIEEAIKRITGTEIKFHENGGKSGGDDAQRNTLLCNFVSWAIKHVDYLPGNCEPEKFILNNMKANTDYPDINKNDPKNYFKELTRRKLGVVDSEVVNANDILTTQRISLATIPNNNPHLSLLHARLKKALSSIGTQI